MNRNLNYEDIVKLNENRSICLIDVRENSEIQETGKLPGSIHIPCKLLYIISSLRHQIIIII